METTENIERFKKALNDNKFTMREESKNKTMITEKDLPQEILYMIEYRAENGNGDSFLQSPRALESKRNKALEAIKEYKDAKNWHKQHEATKKQYAELLAKIKAPTEKDKG